MKLFRKASMKAERNQEDLVHWYNRIEMSNATQLSEELPLYLAHDAYDVCSAYEKPLVVQLDGYEALVNKLKQGDLSNLRDTWLRGRNGLIKQIPNILWVIAGREQLTWDEELLPADHKHLIGVLSENDSESFFKKAGITDTGLIGELYALTQGTPVYMDLCVKTYHRILADKGQEYHPKREEFGLDIDELAARYLRDMTPGQQKIVQLISCLPNTWDDALVRGVATSIGYDVFLTEYPVILELSLVEKTGTYFKLHETFRNVVLSYMKKEEKEKICGAMLQYQTTWLEKADADDYKAPQIEKAIQSLDNFAEYVTVTEEQLEVMYKTAKEYESQGDYFKASETMKTLIRTAEMNQAKDSTRLKCCADEVYYLYRIGDYNGSYELGEKTYNEAKTLLGEDDEVSLHAVHSLSTAVDALGDNKTAKVLVEKVYNARARILGEEHPATLHALHSLASRYAALGDRQKAFKLTEEVRDARVRVLGEEHPDTLNTLHNLAIRYSALGDKQKAFELIEKVYNLTARILGEEHPDTLSSLHNLANRYSDLGDKQKALELTEKVYNACVRVLGEEHPTTLNALHNLAIWYSDLGDKQKALELAERAYHARVRVLGEEHPATRRSKQQVTTYRMICEKAQDEEDSDTPRTLPNLKSESPDLSDKQKAIELAEKSYKTKVQLLSEGHPDTLTELHNLARCYADFGNKQKAFELTEKVYCTRARVLGENHPDTRSALNDLATRYLELDDRQKAFRLTENVGDGGGKGNDEESLTTLTTMSNLANRYATLGDKQTALELTEMAYKASVQLLDEGRSDILQTMNNLANRYSDLGDKQKALELTEMAYKASVRLLGEVHQVTLQMLHELGNRYASPLDEQSVEQKNRAYIACMRVLGEEQDPDTLRSMLDLAYDISYFDKSKSKDLTKKVFEAQVSLLKEGNLDADTLSKHAGLEVRYFTLGEDKKAAKLNKMIENVRQKSAR